MAKVIAIVGTKGGSGKSSTAHLIAHGAGSLTRPITAVVLVTDPGDRMRDDARRYGVMDARSRDTLIACMRRFLPVERLLIVIDGAASRPDLDAVVADVADLAVLPFRASVQDAERAADDLARMPGAVALPTGWPRHPGTAKRAKQWLAMIPPDRRLPPFPHLPRLDGLLSAEGYSSGAYDLASPARGLVLEVFARAGIDPADIEEPRK
jgi:hypothetical protein